MKLSYDEARQDPQRTMIDGPAVTKIDDPPTLPPFVELTGSGFFDPNNTGEAPGTIHLRRVLRDGKETFLVDGQIGYRDKERGVFLVPNPAKPFTTDLTSVPQIFTWLVPKSGEHLPAAILHDGLVPPWQRTYVGPEKLTRQEADRIFRDAMRDLGTGWIRRWLVWTAVTFATEADEGFNRGAWKTGHGVRILIRLSIFIGTIVILGTMATIDLFDRAALLPWMGDRTTPYELLVGGLFALVIPAALSLLFVSRKMVRAALILGIAMALLLHATLFILVLLLLYNGAEAAISAAQGRDSWKAAGRWFAGLGAAVVGLLVLVKVAMRIPRGWGWSFKVPLVESVADGIGRLGTWIWDLSGAFYLVPLAVCLLLFCGLLASKSRPSPGNTDGAAAA